MYRKLVIAAMLVAAYQGWKHFEGAPEPGRPVAHHEVIMYSLTTCGFCKARARELHAEGVAFKEYYIDRDTMRRNELNAKLEQAGYPPRTYGTPIMDVHGWVLPNNPSLDVIKEYMNKDG